MTGFTSEERAIVTAAALGLFLVQLDWFAVNLMLPAIARDFHCRSSDLHWLVSGYMLMLGSLMITGGRASDLYGRRRVMVVAMIGFAVTSALCAAAQNVAWLLIARAGQGAFAALTFPVTLAMAGGDVHIRRQTQAVGTVVGIGELATALGPFVGGVFAEHVGWRMAFLINVPLGVAAAALALRFIPDLQQGRTREGLSLPSVVILVSGLLSIMLMVDQGSAWGWASPRMVATASSGLALLGVFALVERRSTAPLLPAGLLRNLPVILITTAGALSNVVYCVVVVLVSLYLQQARGLSPTAAGSVFLALSAGSGTAAYWSGYLARRRPPSELMQWGMVLSGVSLLSLTWIRPLGWFIVAFAFCGIGVGTGWSLTNVATQAQVHPRHRAVTSGFVLTVLALLAGIAIDASSALLEAMSSSVREPASDAAAIEKLLRGTAMLAFAGAAVLVPLRRRQRAWKPPADLSG